LISNDGWPPGFCSNLLDMNHFILSVSERQNFRHVLQQLFCHYVGQCFIIQDECRPFRGIDTSGNGHSINSNTTGC